jgi:LCP family protein required for cell wall assembly
MPPRHAAVPDGHRRRGRTALIVVVGVLGLAVLVGGGALALTVRSLEGNVEREQVFGGLDEQERPDDEPTRSIDLLVLGSDSREDEIGATLDGADTVEGERADTTLLVRLTADRDAAWVVSIPRDSYVSMPACTGRDGEPIPAREEQFNFAYRDGGLPCAVRTVEALSGVRIDHTVVVDFTGFTEMVNALDGVPVCLDEPFRPRQVALELPAGRHVLRDFEALEFVRARYGLGDGTDIDRIERQKQFMASMFDRAMSRQLLVRPDRLVRFLDAATKSLRVDEDLDLRDLALSVRGIEGERVVFSTVPIDPDPGPEFAEGGRLFGRVALDQDAADALFTDLKNDRLPIGGATPAPETTGPASPTAEPTAPPSAPAATTAASPCT